MTEERAPYTGENDPPAPTMFERLCKRLTDTIIEQISANDDGMTYGHDDDGCGPLFIDGTIQVPGVIRALLAEMRDAADQSGDMRPPPPATTANPDPAESWVRWGIVRDAIDTILAEAGKSGSQRPAAADPATSAAVATNHEVRRLQAALTMAEAREAHLMEALAEAGGHVVVMAARRHADEDRARLVREFGKSGG